MLKEILELHVNVIQAGDVSLHDISGQLEGFEEVDDLLQLIPKSRGLR